MNKVTLIGGPFDEKVIELPCGTCIEWPLELFTENHKWSVFAMAVYVYSDADMTTATFQSIKLTSKGGWVRGIPAVL